jgi:hypothetical protein
LLTSAKWLFNRYAANSFLITAFCAVIYLDLAALSHNMKFESFEKAEQWLSNYDGRQRFGLLLEWAPDGKIIEETWEGS